jgi:hypothetical protein
MTYDRPAVPATLTPRFRPIAIFVTALAALLIGPGSARAQSSGGHGEVFVGSEFESYLRYLQTLGKSPPSSWSIRHLSPGQLDALAPSDSLHPWGNRYDFRRPAKT